MVDTPVAKVRRRLGRAGGRVHATPAAELGGYDSWPEWSPFVAGFCVRRPWVRILPRLPADSLYRNKGHACCACGGLGAFSRCLLGACVRHSRGRDGSSARNGRRFSYGRSPCLKAQYIQPCSPVAVSCLGLRLWVKIGTGWCGTPVRRRRRASQKAMVFLRDFWRASIRRYSE